MLSPNGTINNRGEKEPLLKKFPKPLASSGMARKLLRGLGAVFAIFLVVAAWAIMAEKLQDLDRTYSRTIFQTYFIHSTYSVLYIVWKIWLVFPGGSSCNRAGEGTLTDFRTLAIVSGVLALFVYVGDIFWFKSLPLTSVSANTAIYQSQTAAVFLLSIPVLRERVTLVKILSVLFSLAGVFLVSFFGSKSGSNSPSSHNSTESFQTEPYITPNSTSTMQLNSSEEEKNTPLGYVLAIISMLLYSTFETIFKKWGTRDDDTAPVWNGLRLTGYIGVHTLLTYWPVVVIVHFMGVETFQLPTIKQFYLLLAMCFLDITFNGALLVAIALSSPLFAIVGTVLTLPATVLLDWILKGYILSWQSFIGVGAIIFGFALLLLSEVWEIRRKDQPTQPSSQQQPQEEEEDHRLASFNASLNSLSSSVKLKLQTSVSHYLI